MAKDSMMQVVGPVRRKPEDTKRERVGEIQTEHLLKSELDEVVTGPFVRNGEFVDCRLVANGLDLPYTASASDPEAYGRAIYRGIVEFYDP